ncbi:polysaccharide deacetylase family protein [Streptomyces carpaticus]|uniref:polysaccharide deacetylase family protein n=1 Tax=Streptomyces TaxID=1883 RepID=UPI001FE482F1|nr:polysaccharide deacetylase family protein [Streptomyces harbinensis]UWM48779.1 polysaccharide deacetylase family protein [Streptomyces carpaticus]
MSSEVSAPSAVPRRVLLGATACVSLLGLNRLLAACSGPSAGAGAAPGPAAAPAAPAADSYRLRPFTPGSAPGAAPPRQPVPVRSEAALTLDLPGKKIALTLDDGPHPTYTPQVLKLLRKHKVPGTFFVIGENAHSHPDLVRAIADEGHLVANHSWSHPQLDTLSTKRVRRELGDTSDLIQDILGAPPGLARAPYGAWDKDALTVCAELGMEPLGWSVDTNDWARPGTSKITASVLDGAHSGAIVLTHDGGGDRSQTVTALGQVLPKLLDRGYELVLPV